MPTYTAPRDNTSPPVAHSRFGGSSAPRVMACPASVGLVAKLPVYLTGKTSPYAMRGTSLHTCMVLLIEREARLDDIAGRAFGDYIVTADDVENSLRPALAYADGLLDQPGAEYFLERRVVFPNVDGAFGTADLLVKIGRTVHAIDFKFGSGVRVLAVYPDGTINAQAAFYAAGARHSLPVFFRDVDDITLTILQPQSAEPDAEMVSSVTVTHADLDAFVARYQAACSEALGPSPRLARGPHCRASFCPARPICPAHTGPLLDLAMFDIPAPTDADYLRLLADGLNLVDAIKDISKALHDQAKAALDHGDTVPGYTLSAGRAVRAWRATPRMLLDLGLYRSDVLAEDRLSVAQVERRAKARGVDIPADFIISSRSGTSLQRVENARVPVPGRDEAVRLFSEALQAWRNDQ
jgi:hypothetical protein